MAVALTIRSAGLTTTRYDELMVGLELDALPSAGQILHVVLETPEGVVIQEVWQTAAAALHHLEHRLTPPMQGVRAGEPEAEVVPLHNLYAADLDVI